MISQYSHLVKRIFDLPIQVSSGPDEEHEIDRDIGTITKEKEPELKKPPLYNCLLYTSPSPRDGLLSRMPSSA